MQVHLTQLIERRAITPCAFALMLQPAVEALALMRDRQGNTPTGSVTADSFLIDCDTRTIEVRPVGLEPHTGGQATDVAAYGQVLSHMLASMPVRHKRIARIALMCTDGQLTRWEDARLALERSESNVIYWALIALIALLLTLLAWLNHTC